LDYERSKKRDGKENKENEPSETIKLLLSALTKCDPTDEDKLSFLELDLQRLMSRGSPLGSSLDVLALKLLDKFAGEC
jgi:hypothetical protein